MSDHERKQLEDFLAAIEPNIAGYNYSTFSYLAQKKGNVFELAQGRLVLQGVPATSESKHFESPNLKVGFLHLHELKTSVKQFIESLLTGKLLTPHGELRFAPEKDRSHSIYFNPFHAEGVPFQNRQAFQYRQMQLHIRGDRRERLDSLSLDWELKAGPIPFEGVQELCAEFGVGQIDGDSSTVEIVAFSVAAIGGESSVTGTKAKLVINLVDGLEREKASIGYRLIERNAVVKRGILSGDALTWENATNFQRGVAELEVTGGAVLHCVASHGGRAQHHYWVADPATAQNPFRAIHQAFDKNLDVLQELVTKAQTKGANARDLEIAVAWLLWMLGFSTTHIGGTPKTSDAPDLIAATPFGHLVVVECTTGILKEDSKLSHLFQRAEKIRQTLISCGNQHLRVLPVIVTTKTRDEVKSELDQAHKNGALVATIEDFPQLINRTLLVPNAERLYTEAEENLKRLQNPSPFDVSGTKTNLLQ
ncbi:MAG: hypothetical protein HOP33_02375 [Verrucomicrobia bacterium]|nr:hypothetical protein [Verrucomicrobiota bacterium]